MSLRWHYWCPWWSNHKIDGWNRFLGPKNPSLDTHLGNITYIWFLNISHTGARRRATLRTCCALCQHGKVGENGGYLLGSQTNRLHHKSACKKFCRLPMPGWLYYKETMHRCTLTYPGDYLLSLFQSVTYSSMQSHAYNNMHAFSYISRAQYLLCTDEKCT